jgi:sialate O-acetylesterase
VYLKPGGAGGPFEMVVTGTAGTGSVAAAQTITLSDVLVGDVWVAAGQSNMEFSMGGGFGGASTAAEDLPKAGIPQIRMLIVKRLAIEYPKDDIDTDVWSGWAASTPETAKDFSAVAWYFAREIEQREHVPVGVIDSTVGRDGGRCVDAHDALGGCGAGAGVCSWGKMTEREENELLRAKDEQRQREEAEGAGQAGPQFPWHPQLKSWAPGMLWNGMIAPLTPFPIRGVIWYQGESNSALARAPLYQRVFSTMIEDWRHEWGIGDFPFLFVQISNFKSNATRTGRNCANSS